MISYPCFASLVNIQEDLFIFQRSMEMKSTMTSPFKYVRTLGLFNETISLISRLELTFRQFVTTFIFSHFAIKAFQSGFTAMRIQVMKVVSLVLLHIWMNDFKRFRIIQQPEINAK